VVQNFLLKERRHHERQLHGFVAPRGAGRKVGLANFLARRGSAIGALVVPPGFRVRFVCQQRSLRIIEDLTSRLQGRFDQQFTTDGSTSLVIFPSRATLAQDAHDAVSNDR
jgi:hypothetical protein